MRARCIFAIVALTVLSAACSRHGSDGSIPQLQMQTRAATGVNLIVNGGAELGDATLTGYDSVTIPGWIESGLPTVVAYGVSDFPSRATPGAGSGKNFFTGGPFSSSTLTQRIDLASASATIDTGAVEYTLSGRLGGKLGSGDDARVTAAFLDGAGNVLGDAGIGPVTARDRKNATGFLPLATTARVPAQTRSVRVVLSFTMYHRFIAGETLDNGYADDLSLVLAAPLPAPAKPPVPVARVPRFDHVFLVYFENSNFGQIVGNTALAPTINAMAKQYALLGNYYALHHPSDANYVLQAAGGTFGLHQNDFFGKTIATTHLADEVERAGGSWKQYMQSARGPCDQHDHGFYYPDDGPYMYFADVKNDAARCRVHIVPWSRFAKDLASTATTPTYAWLSPDDCSDMESCGIRFGDEFLKKWILGPLFASPAWKKQRTLLVVSWDEDDFTPVNHIPGILIASAGIKHGFVSPVLYTHYSVLRTIEAALGLPTLTDNDRYAQPVNDVWR